MRYRRLFGRAKKEIARKFESKNQELLLRGGFIDQVASGIYTLLPLGVRVLKKINWIIREEMEKIGGQEILLPALHPKKLWEVTGRWDSFDALFKTKSRYGGEYALGPTHEEIITPLVAKFVRSWRDLPVFLYQIQTKFRDEPRPKSGILRGREFGMKDFYSFHASREDLEEFYKKVKEAYLAVFARCGLLKVKITEASGGSFTKKFSHEFNVITPAGEVDLIYCPRCFFAQNEEIAKVKEGDPCPACLAKDKLSGATSVVGKNHSFLRGARAIEVGNIFDLGEKFSRDFNLKFRTREGKEKYVVMGCYGIGTTRLMGAIVEVHHDERGIIWPESVAPYQVHLIEIPSSKQQTSNSFKTFASQVYQRLKGAGIEVLYDDREGISAGEKLVTADLLGMPVRLVISEKTGEKIEWKERKSKKTELLNLEKLIKRLNKRVRP